MIIVGAKTQNHVMGLGPHSGRSVMSEERKWMLKGFPTQFSWIGAFEVRSEEECLLECHEYGSNMYSIYQKDPPQQTLVVGMRPTDL